MPHINSLNKKGIAWPYIVGMIIGILVLLMLLYLAFKGKMTLSGVITDLGGIF